MAGGRQVIGSLFSGIGALDLGLERAGLGDVAWQAEVDPYCRDVLARHWPSAKRFSDVREVTRESAARVRVLCGGFPCQPASVAGRRRGQSDERWLWPEYARIIAELEPAIVVAENVPGLRTMGLRDVLGDLAALGFDAEWATASAFDFGAPHLRRRIYIVATHPGRVVVRDEPGWLSRALERQAAPIPRDFAPAREPADSDSARRLESARRLAGQRGWSEHVGWDIGPLARVDDGLARGVVGKRRKALGNAVVVQHAQAVGVAVREAIDGAQAEGRYA